ncbi:MAG: S8 family serine peptidase, partial [Oscillospiraceae bacterium]|nr:S8 family serine peptidase [Oscillospiraceae bacterium]
ELPEEVSVRDAVSAAADLQNDLPAVFPNFIYQLPEPIIEDEKATQDLGAFAYDSAPKKQFWSNDFGDTYLKNPNAGTGGYQWFHDAIGSFSAWGTTMGEDVIVAVLDTGVQSNHPDLSPAPGVLPGRNESNPSTPNDTNDVAGHGTHVAGIIAARANTVGGRGVAPKAAILPVKVLSDTGSGTTATTTSGINWVINGVNQRRADIINMSLGGYGYDTLCALATANAIKKGIVVVAAAGNDGTNNRCTPADYPGVVCVASTDMNGQRSSFSNYGPQITISAPGSEILSTIPGSLYKVMGGTSMATPVVAGAIALYISQMATMPANEKDVADVVKAMVKYATPAGSPGIGKIVNVGNMFNDIKAPSFSVNNGVTDLKAAIPNNCTVTVHGVNFIVYTTDGSNPSVKDGLVLNGMTASGDSATIALSSLPVGKVTIKALSVNGQGSVSKVATLTITTVPALSSTTSSGGMGDISGPKYLGAGKSAKYTAAVTALAASGTSKTVTWSIDSTSEIANATIKKDGTLSIPAGAEGGKKVYVVATASGPATCVSEFTVTVTPLIQSLSVALPSSVTGLRVGVPSGVQPGSCTLAQSAGLADGNSLSNLTGYVNWTSSNAKIATVDGTGKVTAVGSGKVTITAKAVDGSGKSANTSINCVLPATAVLISGNSRQIAAKGSVTLKAATTPTKPTKTGVDWAVDSASAALGVSITTTGKLSIPAGVSSGHVVTVTATAKDGYGASGSVAIQVVAQKASSVAITTIDASGRATLKSGKVSSVALFTLNPPSVTDYDRIAGGSGATVSTVNETFIDLDGYAGGNICVWQSNNLKVADVDEHGRVTAIGAGKATITCTASDGSGKKATCTVNVLIPASSVWVQGKNARSEYSDPTLGFGKSLGMSAKHGGAYGKVSNTKVKWKKTVFRGSTPSSTLDKYVSVSSSGKLSANKQLLELWKKDDVNYWVEVTAEALDGSGVSGSVAVYLCPAATKIAFRAKTQNFYQYTSDYVYFTSDSWYEDFIITSSNPKAVAVCAFQASCVEVGIGTFRVPITTFARGGKATIKVVVNDGSGKSASTTINVK